MTLTKRISELMQAITASIPEREFCIQLGFLTTLVGEPFYLYVNVTTPEMLRKVLANPKKYAPSGVYIVRIHGTFVNFLDLSPEIQEDIIARLDPASTSL